MEQQLCHLLEVASYPNVTIRVVPFSAGMYQRLLMPYVLFEFPDAADENVLYVENPSGEYLIREDAPEEATGPPQYLEIFWQLEQFARKEDFAGMVDDALAGLEKASPDRPS
jgi:hypothetical protein